MHSSIRIQHIDAWRLIAVVLVLVCHIAVYSHPWYREHFPGLVWRLQSLGTFGVQIFFCISGFVICRGLMHEYENKGRVSIKGFYIRRLFRIVPPLSAYLFTIYILSICGVIHVFPSEFAQASLFLCNINLKSCGWFVGHTWSLAYEEQFYAFFPLIFVRLVTKGKRRGIAILTVVVMISSLLARSMSYVEVAEYASTFVYMLTGCVAALYWNKLQVSLSHMPIAVWAGLLVITPALTSFVVLPSPLRYFFAVIVAPPAICAVVLGTPVVRPSVARFFLNPVISHLGKVSFSIYLWQQLATADVFHAPLYFSFVALLGVFTLALLSYKYFEMPLIRLGSTYSNAARSEKAPMPAMEQTGGKEEREAA
jgi:peptidoglycan/LPS O-acetylase OafA/YrhL